MVQIQYSHQIIINIFQIEQQIHLQILYTLTIAINAKRGSQEKRRRNSTN